MITIDFEHASESEIVRGRPSDAGAPAPAIVWELARMEGRRILRHPAFLVGCAITLAWFLYADLPNDLYLGLVGAGAVGPALGTILAANAGELRSRTSGTDELLGSIPLGHRARTASMLVASLWPALATLVLVAVLGLWTGALDGAPVALPGGVVEMSPTAVEWLQGVAIVVFAGVLGVVLGGLVPSRLFAVMVTVASGLTIVPTFFWGASGPDWWWLAPLVFHGESFSWVQVNPGAGYSVLTGFDAARLAWHLAYLAGITSVLAGVAMLRYGRGRGPATFTACGALVAVVAGVVQFV